MYKNDICAILKKKTSIRRGSFDFIYFIHPDVHPCVLCARIQLVALETDIICFTIAISIDAPTFYSAIVKNDSIENLTQKKKKKKANDEILSNQKRTICDW